MTKQTEKIMAQEVSLIELLRSVPENSRLIVDSRDGLSSKVHPIGFLCHKAAETLEQPNLTYEDGFAHGYEAHRAEQALDRPTNMVAVPADQLKKMQQELKQLRREHKNWQGFSRRVNDD